jgi:outer membrane receptor protein involved in Fe transport
MTPILLVLWMISADAGAAERAVTGHVQDSVGGSVAGADVFVACGAIWRHTVTGPDGRFSITGLPEGRCGLRVEGEQFSPKRLPIDLARADAQVTVVLDLQGLTEEVAVTPSRGGEEAARRVPAHTTITDAEAVRSRIQQILPQALAEEPGIVVQQTTSAQGAPVIRGLIGYQNVAIIDGVRLNTSAWRSGPLQYLAWYDASLVDRIEVMRGPASVLYGSDALGGTVHVRSVQPSFALGSTQVGGVANVMVSSADGGRGGNARVDVRGRRAAFVAGGGYADFDDIRPGKGIDSHAAVTRFLGLPSTVLDTTRMRGTGFSQRFGHAAAAVGVGASSRLDASYHYDEQVGASRYDRIGGGEGLFRSEFGPQRLDLAQVRLERGRTGFVDGLTASLSFNRQADGRLEQARPGANIDAQQNATTAIGYQVHGVRALPRQQLTAGAEVYDEYISGTRTITSAAGVRPARADIPDGTRYTTFGVFAQDVVDVVPGRLSVRGGLRYGRFAFGTSADPALGVVDESVTSDAMTFQGGAVLNLTDTLALTASAGRAFRAPNASDFGAIGVSSVFEVAPERVRALGGLMGTNGGANAVSTGRPIEPLRPETLYSFEGGIRYNGRRAGASLAAYTVEMRDALQRRTVIFERDITGTVIGGFEIVRQDAAGRAYTATNATPMGTSVNVSAARIRGFEADGRIRLRADLLAAAWYSYSRGTDLEADVPLRRVPPGVGGVRLRWEPPSKPFWVEGVATFMTRYSRMAPGDLSDARMGARRTASSIAGYFNGAATDLGLVRNGILVPTGETLAQVQQRLLGGAASSQLFDELPGYVVATVRGAYRLTPQIELFVIGDNLGDVNYRRLGSGVDGPGRHVRVSTRITF